MTPRMPARRGLRPAFHVPLPVGRCAVTLQAVYGINHMILHCTKPLLVSNMIVARVDEVAEREYEPWGGRIVFALCDSQRHLLILRNNRVVGIIVYDSMPRCAFPPRHYYPGARDMRHRGIYLRSQRTVHHRLHRA